MLLQQQILIFKVIHQFTYFLMWAYASQYILSTIYFLGPQNFIFFVSTFILKTILKLKIISEIFSTFLNQFPYSKPSGIQSTRCLISVHYICDRHCIQQFFNDFFLSIAETASFHNVYYQKNIDLQPMELDLC